MESIKVIHISDIHVAEHITRGADKHFNVPHRYGHDVTAFFALDSFLKNSEWDLLIITGDVSRIGNSQSFEYVRNWLEGEIHIGAHCLGLNLLKQDKKEYVIIPGNHDRFNGKLVQGNLENYYHEFPTIRSGSCKSYFIREERVNIHLYDSTEDNRTFAYGFLEESDLVPKEADGNLNLAILHHHFIQPPKHKREAATELLNSSDVSAYFLNSGFHGVLFGHTHQSYIGTPSINALCGVLPDKRRIKRLLKRLLPKYFLRKIDNDCLVSYRRESAKNGQFPTLESYFNYLYLSKRGVKLKSPSNFDKIESFYKHISEAMEDDSLSNELERLKEKKILISLAPSACQAETKWKGFHEITFKKQPNGEFEITWERYQYNGAKFIKKDRDEHLS